MLPQLHAHLRDDASPQCLQALDGDVLGVKDPGRGWSRRRRDGARWVGLCGWRVVDGIDEMLVLRGGTLLQRIDRRAARHERANALAAGHPWPPSPPPSLPPSLPPSPSSPSSPPSPPPSHWAECRSGQVEGAVRWSKLSVRQRHRRAFCSVMYESSQPGHRLEAHRPTGIQA
jgi:hypothetical protein